MRYEIRVIANTYCTEIHDETLESTNDINIAKKEAAQLAGTFPYGGAILDTQSGLIDFGFGFGVSVPEPEEEEEEEA